MKRIVIFPADKAGHSIFKLVSIAVSIAGSIFGAGYLTGRKK